MGVIIDILRHKTYQKLLKQAVFCTKSRHKSYQKPKCAVLIWSWSLSRCIQALSFRGSHCGHFTSGLGVVVSREASSTFISWQSCGLSMLRSKSLHFPVFSLCCCLQRSFWCFFMRTVMWSFHVKIVKSPFSSIFIMLLVPCEITFYATFFTLHDAPSRNLFLD